MIDAHAHLHDEKFDNDREEIMSRAKDAGLTKIVTIGTSLSESEEAIATAEQYDNVFATVGMHPHVFNGGPERPQEWQADIGADVPAVVRRERLEEAIYDLDEMIAGSDKVVAVGEIGLDYFDHGGGEITSVQRSWQEEGFHGQVDLAMKHELPVVVHCRPDDVAKSDAYFDCAELLSDHASVQFVFHCYMGNRNVTEKLLTMNNALFSFTGNVTYSKSDDDEMSEVVKMIPLDRMMIETDCPYLTPVPHRGKRNEPAYVQFVAERIAHLKGISVDDAIKQTVENTEKFFKL